MWRWGLQEVIRSEGGDLRWDSCPYKRDGKGPSHPFRPCEDMWTRKGALTRYWICTCLDRGLSSLQSCEIINFCYLSLPLCGTCYGSLNYDNFPSKSPNFSSITVPPESGKGPHTFLSLFSLTPCSQPDLRLSTHFSHEVHSIYCHSSPLLLSKECWPLSYLHFPQWFLYTQEHFSPSHCLPLLLKASIFTWQRAF